MLDRVEQRPAHEELAAEQVVQAGGPALALGRDAARLDQPDREHLACVAPVVQRVRGVDALVALQPDQACAEHVGERLRDLGLADAGLTLEQQRLAERERHVQHRREAAISQVRAAGELLGELVDRTRAVLRKRFRTLLDGMRSRV